LPPFRAHFLVALVASPASVTTAAWAICPVTGCVATTGEADLIDHQPVHHEVWLLPV
jgi:hypothetical protein